MKKQFFFIALNLLCFSYLSLAQNVILEGYVFQDNNRGFLNEVDIQIFDATNDNFVTKAITNIDGFFSVELPKGKDFIVKTDKDLFFPKEEMISTKGKTKGGKVYLKIKMERKPGYIFDVTLAEKGAPRATVNAISGAKVEVYNNTKLEETLVIDSVPGINFDVTFERGNHYTVLIRKEDFFNKRLEAYVDVEGCILCFEGVGTVTPGMSDVMSQGFKIGSVLANIELEPARLNQTMRIDNIYYDTDKYFIRKDAAIELNKVVKLLNDNPSVIIELGAHTDSRGGTRHNKLLSTNRAKAAVKYIISNGGISSHRISAKGYGETELVNKCTDGVKCSEAEHQLNRRTELKIVGFKEDNSMAGRSLAEIITEERLLREIENSEQIQVAPGEVPPNFNNKLKANPKQPKPKQKKATPSAEKTNLAANGKADTPKKMIRSVSDTNETLVASAGNNKNEGMERNQVNKTLSNKNRTDKIPEFGIDKVMIIKNGQVQLITKIINTQLNPEITDMIIGKPVFLEVNGAMKKYKFDKIELMPASLLNAFLKKIALVKKDGGWQMFQMKNGATLPKELINSLK